MCSAVIGVLESLVLMLFGYIVHSRMYVPDEYSTLVTSFIIVGIFNLVAHAMRCNRSWLIGFTVLKLVVVGAEAYYALVMLNQIAPAKYEYFQFVACGGDILDYSAGKLQRFFTGQNACAKRVGVFGSVLGAFFVFGVIDLACVLKKICSSKENKPVRLVSSDQTWA